MSNSILRLKRATSCALSLVFLWFSSANGMPEKLLLPGQQVQAPAQPGQPATPPPLAATGLHIVMISGDKAANIVNEPATRTVIEVRDASNSPVAGAMVTFTSPSDGPGVIFASGQREAAAMTDDAGRATTPVGTAVNTGIFQYQIAATYREQQANATSSETNFLTAADAAKSGATGPTAKKHSSKAMWFILGAAAVAGGVGAAAFHGNSSGSAASSGSSATIGPGSGSATVGAPH